MALLKPEVFISTAVVIILLCLLALQDRKYQVAVQPIRRPKTASTAASHVGTVSEPFDERGRAVLCVAGTEAVVEVRGWSVPSVLGADVVVEMGKLFTFVKM